MYSCYDINQYQSKCKCKYTKFCVMQQVKNGRKKDLRVKWHNLSVRYIQSISLQRIFPPSLFVKGWFFRILFLCRVNSLRLSFLCRVYFLWITFAPEAYPHVLHNAGLVGRRGEKVPNAGVQHHLLHHCAVSVVPVALMISDAVGVDCWWYVINFDERNS